MDNQPPEPPKEDIPSPAGPAQPTSSPQPIQPEVAPSAQSQPSSNTTGPLMPGQVIGSNPATPQQSQPVEAPASPMQQSVVGNFSSETNPNKRKKWMLVVAGIVALVLVILAVIFFLRPKNKSDDNTSSSTKTSQSSNDGSSDTAAKNDETSSWKTYSDKLITLKYPDGWSMKQIPNVNEGNFHITPPGKVDITGYLGEDNFTDNAKTNNSKAYWQTAYNSDKSEKIIGENSDSVNGYNTYNVEVKNSTFGSTTYSIVGKSGVKIVVFYPTNDKNNDTYEKIVNTIKFN